MGFREGEGLGKFGQGRKEIVEASTQRGRRGLGLKVQGFQGELNVDWRDEPEVRLINNYSDYTLNYVMDFKYLLYFILSALYLSGCVA